MFDTACPILACMVWSCKPKRQNQDWMSMSASCVYVVSCWETIVCKYRDEFGLQ